MFYTTIYRVELDIDLWYIYNYIYKDFCTNDLSFTIEMLFDLKIRIYNFILVLFYCAHTLSLFTFMFNLSNTIMFWRVKTLSLSLFGACTPPHTSSRVFVTLTKESCKWFVILIKDYLIIIVVIIFSKTLVKWYFEHEIFGHHMIIKQF